MGVLAACLLLLSGYTATAVGYYLNHRFIFHGRMPRWVPKRIKRAHRWYAGFHMRHHLHAEQDDELVEDYLKIPTAGKVVMVIMLLVIAMASISFSIGCLIFFTVYGIRHGAIHGVGRKKLSKDSYHYRHHMLHHKKGNWGEANFSGVHPWIDKVFGSYRQS